MPRPSSLFQRHSQTDKQADSGSAAADNTDRMAALTEVYRGQDPVVDIIAIHGLNGDAMNAFTTTSEKRFWLGDPDMLPRDINNCRILTYSYAATVAAVLGRTSSDRILQHAHTLVAELVADRELDDAVQRPIIFLCHSLGGIIAKRALIYSAGRTGDKVEHLHSIYTSTYGMLFFGVPHHGCENANLAALAQKMVDVLVPSKLVDTDSQLLDALKAGSEVLQDITDNFVPLMKRLRIYFFWEQEKTNLGMKWDYIVPESSAAPILDNTDRAGLRNDHRNMCKFASRTSPGYRLVVAGIRRYTRDAPSEVSRRWHAEKNMLRLMRRNEAMELNQEADT